MADQPPMDPAYAAENRAWVTISVASVTLFLATLSVLLRVYTRMALIKQFGMDDFAAVVTMLIALGCGAAVLTNVKYGLGRHMGTFDASNIPLYFRSFYVSIVLYNATLMSVKITFLLQYYRVFALRKMRIFVLAALGLIGCWSVSQLLVAIFNCTPIYKFWMRDSDGTCIPNHPFWYINAAGNIITDIVIFVLPLPVLGSLKLRRPQKLVLVGIFSLGFFTCAISVIRIRYLHTSDDATWDNVGLSTWSVTQISAAIICVCLPTLRPVVSKLAPTLLSSRSLTNTKGYQQHSYGRDPPNSRSGPGSHHRHLESSFGKDSCASNSSRRGVLSAEELELRHMDSDPDGPQELQHQSQQQQQPDRNAVGVAVGGGGERGSRTDLGHARLGSAFDNDEQLGLRSSVKTEVRVAPQPTWQRMGPNGRGIGIQRDVIIAKSGF